MYSCMFPDCTYSVTNREKIDYHHIIPKELGGSDRRFNRCWLCPTHHRHIYVPESENGIHSMKGKGSIIIKGFLKTTSGIALHYINCDDAKEYAFLYSKSMIIPLN